jgi:hypothetical protein
MNMSRCRLAEAKVENTNNSDEAPERLTPWRARFASMRTAVAAASCGSSENVSSSPKRMLIETHAAEIDARNSEPM